MRFTSNEKKSFFISILTHLIGKSLYPEIKRYLLTFGLATIISLTMIYAILNGVIISKC